MDPKQAMMDWAAQYGLNVEEPPNDDDAMMYAGDGLDVIAQVTDDEGGVAVILLADGTMHFHDPEVGLEELSPDELMEREPFSSIAVEEAKTMAKKTIRTTLGELKKTIKEAMEPKATRRMSMDEFQQRFPAQYDETIEFMNNYIESGDEESDLNELLSVAEWGTVDGL